MHLDGKEAAAATIEETGEGAWAEAAVALEEADDEQSCQQHSSQPSQSGVRHRVGAP